MNTGDNSNHTSEEEDYFTEEYEEYYVPAHLVKEDEIANTNFIDIASYNTHANHNDTEKSPAEPVTKIPPKVKTITRVDEETDNVVILIRPRRRSLSEERQSTAKHESDIKVTDTDESSSVYIYETKRPDKDEIVKAGRNKTEKSGKDEIKTGNETTVNVNKNNKSKDVVVSIPINNHENENREEHVNCMQTSLDNDALDECHNCATQKDSGTENDTDYNGNRNNSEDKKLEYERQGARPKVPVTHSTAVMDIRDGSCVTCTSVPRAGISKEVSAKVRKLKETGDFDNLVENYKISRNEGVIHDIVEKIHTDKSDSDISEEDDILIFNLMKSLKEKTKVNEFGQGDKFAVNDNQPEGKCDWSYEKATLSKDKYLSRRLQTKEIGQVKVVTFLSPYKENGKVEIAPLKVSRTLPFNVKHIFQQKMDEIKNKDRICLTGGKELMFTNMNVDRLNSREQQIK